MKAPTTQITVIIPVRIERREGDALARLSYIQHDETYYRYVEVIVVDDGSPREFAQEIAATCEKLNFKYLRLDTENKVFSIARCRNKAAMEARTRYIFFQDIDLVPTDGFYQKLTHEISIIGLPDHNNNMIMIPVAYLTSEATPEFLENHEPCRFQSYMDHLIHRNRQVFEKFSTGTSACLYDRFYYLSCGGNFEEFSGWGFEDLEFNTRVVLDSKRYPRPREWLRDISSFDIQTRYQGWKSAYRLFGDRSLLKGLLLFHAWHPIADKSSYRLQIENNRRLFRRHMKRFAGSQDSASPLPSLNRGKTLVFRNNPFTLSKELQPLMGEIKLESEDSFPSRESFLQYFQESGFSRVVFHNPYANDAMKNIYLWSRDENLPLIVAERGALNDSVFYDSTGFLDDSKLYSEEFWNCSLSDKERDAIIEYIRGHDSQAVSLLESQGQRVTSASLKKKLNITSNDKVILVCLQRPGDTATRFFNGNLGTYQDFLIALENLSQDLPGNYKLLIKQHPLEDCSPNIPATNVGDYHLYDLFDIADTLIVYNSGTGIQALMRELPVITCGRAFYDHSDLTHHIDDYKSLVTAALHPKPVNKEARLRFLHYLVEKFYSFGSFSTRETRMDNGDRMTATVAINFNILRFDGIECRYYHEENPIDNWESMLFDRYLWEKRERLNSSPKRLFKRFRLAFIVTPYRILKREVFSISTIISGLRASKTQS